MTKNLLDGLNSKAEFRQDLAGAVTILDLGNAQKRIPNSRATIRTYKSHIPPTYYQQMLWRARERAEAPLALIHTGGFRPYLPEAESEPQSQEA